jgi:hypothetical protein
MKEPAARIAALALVLTGVLGAITCQPGTAPVRRRAPPSPPAEPELPLTLCERWARPSPPAEDAAVEASFRAFASEWLDKRRENARAGTHLEIRDDVEIELRATGSEEAPWVGTLRYCEHQSDCPGLIPESCTPSRSSVVTEIFRLQEGEWQY